MFSISAFTIARIAAGLEAGPDVRIAAGESQPYRLRGIRKNIS